MTRVDPSDEQHTIIDETRRSIIDAILAMGSLAGDKEYHEFAKWVCPSLSESEISDIARHMDRFDDWPESYLVDTVIDYLKLPDEEFMLFLTQYVNPNIHHWRWLPEEERRENIPNSELVEVINKYLEHDGYKLSIKDTIGDKNFYQCVSTRIGVQGAVKNIIFAAKYKPEIVFDDALNNDIRITKNASQCLIYNRAIPQSGLMWSELVAWYSAESGITENQEVALIKRLCDCLDVSFKASGQKSGPETWMLQAYYELKKELRIDLPALLPQVYLYYDPLTQRERGYKLFEHQKMDFLMIFSHRDRVVIEIDGKQHYAVEDKASPKLYSDMVKAHREMSLFGYDVYRFGGYEFFGADSDEVRKKAVLDNLKQFFIRLFRKYGIVPRVS
jgi:very-short-patch-repair endonuclease